MDDDCDGQVDEGCGPDAGAPAACESQADGTPCDDGNACTKTDACQSGTCIGADPVICTAQDQCRAGSCNTSTGVCSYQAKTDGATCDDGVACTFNDACVNGACRGTPYACAPLDQCQTSSACNGDGTCGFASKPDGTTCALEGICAAACASGLCQPAAPGGMLGDGTLASPFLVTTCDQLQAMQQGLSCAYRLANDIDCSGTPTWNGGEGFMPVGNASAPFTGDLDGSGRHVDDLTINRPGTNNQGLFGASGGAIHDVGLVNAKVEGMHYCGALVGWQSRGTITNSYATGTLVTGGPACVYVGGLVGHQNGTITTSYTTGTVTSAAASSGVGGFVGGQTGGAITSSYATVTVTAGKDSSGVGGLVGTQQAVTASISSSYAAGSVSVAGSSSSAVGGLVGRQAGTVTNCYSTASVTGSYYVGGLVGQVAGALTASYATGSVKGSYYDGQLAGMLQGGGTVTNCFATGSVTNTNGAGGLVGMGSAITASYWFDNAGDSASECYPPNGNAGCTKIDSATGIAYFYDTSNPPMSTWTFGPGGDWSVACDSLFFPPLAWQGLAASDCH